MRTFLRWALVGPLAVLALHCSGGTQPTPDTGGMDGTGADSARDVAQPDATDITVTDTSLDIAPDIAPDTGPPVPREIVYVFSSLTIDPSDDPRDPHTGFNLDGLFSTAADSNGCNMPDRFSGTDLDQQCPMADGGHCVSPNPGCMLTDPGCIGGVDNQMPTLSGLIMTVTRMDPRAALMANVSTNHLVVLVRLTNVDSLVNDPDVSVTVFQGYSNFSTMCDMVLANREYQVSSNSIATGGTTLDDAKVHLQGSIVNGRLISTALNNSEFELSYPVSPGNDVLLHLREGQLRMDLALDGATNINMGGWAPGSELNTQLQAMYGDAGLPISIASIIGSLCDIQVNGICDGSTMTPPTFGGISAGFGATAVRATINAANPIATMAGAGTCTAM